MPVELIRDVDPPLLALGALLARVHDGGGMEREFATVAMAAAMGVRWWALDIADATACGSNDDWPDDPCSVPAYATHIRLSNVTGQTMTPPCLLDRAWHVVEVDVSGLSGITRITDQFLRNCPALERVDLRPMRRLRQLGEWFMERCVCLRDVRLPVGCITTVDGNAFFGCASLEHLDLAAFAGVTELHHSVLRECGLHAVDLSPLRNVRSVGNLFLAYNPRLRAVDLTPLTSMERVGEYFLQGCASLETVVAPPRGPLATFARGAPITTTTP